ncbi:hypothetical protein ACQEVM_10730 [Streptomyces sp. CA-243310]|uniref:hypothetical protein n=1 Tax=Streptomyces sp. CA-243310 TaxID=3240056 RepID=UPI003D89FE36
MNRGSSLVLTVTVTAACTASLGSVAAARTAVVPAASCSVAVDRENPNQVVVSGEGFKGTSVTLTAAGGDGTIPDIPVTNGSFTSPSVRSHVYTAESPKDPAVGCGIAPASPQSPPPSPPTSPPPANEQYRTGYQQGLKDTLATCEKNPPKNLAPDPNWQSGYDKGAETAINSKRCAAS